MERDLIKDILMDVKVELDDEFDRNFERKAFFERPWAPVKNDPGTGSLMQRTGALRKSISSEITGNSITYSSSLAYASIHNEGGVINQTVTVTEKMRRWAWAKWHASKDKDGNGSNYWRNFALTKKTSISRKITMPERRFIGEHPTITNVIQEIAGEHLKTAVEETLANILNK
jgi:phage gpG-like protein